MTRKMRGNDQIPALSAIVEYLLTRINAVGTIQLRETVAVEKVEKNEALGDEITKLIEGSEEASLSTSFMYSGSTLLPKHTI
jgi:hypothetical protein